MSKESVWRALEAKMLRYRDYASMEVVPNGEPFVELVDSESVRSNPIDPEMRKYTGDKTVIRETVAHMLKTAGKRLRSLYSGAYLEVVYGYRPLEIQRAIFARVKAEMEPDYVNTSELLEAVHRFIAAPDVAGHPTGGAVDVQIVRNGTPLVFGTAIHAFTPESYTFNPFIATESWRNRQLLRRVMEETGFAPFDGEWWHFSYGDKEWAKYYNEPNAVYEQIDYKAL
jgi:zinc D-Ala-D-Ala dipeptidase